MRHKQANRNHAGKVTAAFLFLLASTVVMTGCSSFEQEAYKSLATSRAVILEARHQADLGNIAKTEANVALINNAQRLHNDAVTAFRSYIEAEIAFNSAKANEAAATALNKTQAINSTVAAQVTLQEKMEAATHAVADVTAVARDVAKLLVKK